jgi:hypothetical protein
MEREELYVTDKQMIARLRIFQLAAWSTSAYTGLKKTIIREAETCVEKKPYCPLFDTTDQSLLNGCA